LVRAQEEELLRTLVTINLTRFTNPGSIDSGFLFVHIFVHEISQN
jgi:hypothetical protein